MAGYNIVGGKSNLNKNLTSSICLFNLNALNGFDLTPICLFLTLDKGMTSPNSWPKPEWFPPDRTDNEVLPMFRTIRRNG
jgi:hypothetical protein